MIKFASKLQLKDRFMQMVVVMQKFQREGFDVEPQTNGKATKSAPYSHLIHLIKSKESSSQRRRKGFSLSQEL